MINYINNNSGQRRPNKHNITSIFSNQNIIDTINIDMYINHQKVSHQKVNHHQSINHHGNLDLDVPDSNNSLLRLPRFPPSEKSIQKMNKKKIAEYNLDTSCFPNLQIQSS